MMIAQSLSLVLSEAFNWRYVLLVGEGIALSLLLIGFLVGRPDGRKDHGGEEERRLLPPSDGELL
jgi:predicted MFS family arabinose efflux permease